MPAESCIFAKMLLTIVFICSRSGTAATQEQQQQRGVCTLAARKYDNMMMYVCYTPLPFDFCLLYVAGLAGGTAVFGFCHGELFLFAVERVWWGEEGGVVAK